MRKQRLRSSNAREGIIMIKNEATVEITGWLNDTKAFSWGTAFKLAVDVRAKNADTGEWETTDKTIYDCTIGEQFSSDAKQVRVSGRITGVNTYAKKDGTTGVSIKVRAEFVDDSVGGLENASFTPSVADTNDAPF